jgi:hypothetical protein
MGWFNLFGNKPAPPASPAPDTAVSGERLIVTEVDFRRDAPAAELRRLGEALAACRRAHDWIAHISGLDELLRGECPGHWSKGIMSPDGTVEPLAYDPILIWGHSTPPGGRVIVDPRGMIESAIPPELGWVRHPVPDGGL